MYQTKGRITKQAHVEIPAGTYEEQHGRDGFFGPVSHLYHRQPPTGWTRIEGECRPQAFYTSRVETSAGRPTVLLENADVQLGVMRRRGATPYFERNADGDELWFAHVGSGVLETDYGQLRFGVGDYLVIPRGTTYRFVGTDECFFFVIQSLGTRLRQPDRGLLGQYSLYDATAIRTPDLVPVTTQAEEYEVRVQREGKLTRIFYPFHPLDVTGWKGDLYPWALNIADFCPVMSHRAHLPPSVHVTLVGEGFVVCSFVPRPLEEAPGAQRVPFYHRNIDYDEVLFYHAGDFFSRDNITAGMLTLHPHGVHHGPHPKAIEKSWSKTHTDEYAVMVDTRRPLHVTDAARAVEWPEYHLSWR
ncbi:homogentisate 1,2-dioxygenase [Chloracidobacterium aggregatum]|uniref:homogentisate 1,2-dioxygenase n=1 Tax=Chloracidobacterium aggregatum TaxID=2851959 RepID=UPI001B8BE22F|nr:homogentisate 1,2-dioxygenase [Chloracidobacterium aggregatum]QUV84180.1 homogentisate 1,2-dioxygenase [Chloracidobacterium sp. 2]QUV87334.1 homogentisate 1,2-dioxygenase [Chloracidobacterium sp. S]QUV90239.1 homogentisate 1,2-dioxygenase [Chloracidobacterium sp. A]QUV96606.1 homogentisate 1,2-dioxygenase [Chloracidobacterium sp. E]